MKWTHRLRKWTYSYGGEGWGAGIDWEFGIDKHTLLYLKQTINKDLLQKINKKDYTSAQLRLENLRWSLIVSILGALFGAFNITDNCKIHFTCVSEKYRLLTCWPYEILHLIFRIDSPFITSVRMFCLGTQWHSFSSSAHCGLILRTIRG